MFYLTAVALGVSAPAPSQCHAGETALYSCQFGRSVGSVCASPGNLHYRFGPIGAPSLDIASAPDWSNIHSGGVIGGGSGSEQHLRFSNGEHNYVVFWGEAGQLTDIPGQRWSGIYVGRGTTDLATLSCKSAAQPVADWADLLNRSLPQNVSEVPADTDPRFDMWF